MHSGIVYKKDICTVETLETTATTLVHYLIQHCVDLVSSMNTLPITVVDSKDVSPCMLWK
jgi:hypothetical protein